VAEKRRLVRYDSRGFGMSERNVADYSLEAHILDLEAVIERVGLERFVLTGGGDSGMIAIAYSARHPERVSHLILWHSYARRPNISEFRPVRALWDQDWETYTELATHVILGWSKGEQARRLAALYRDAATPEAMQSCTEAIYKVDVTDLLPLVRVPTLVLHRRQFPLVSVDIARGLAARIPDARLVLLEGESAVPWMGDMEAVLAASDEFLGEDEEVTAALAAVPSGLVTILFTDIEGSTSLTQRLGDAKAQELLRTHNTIVRDALTSHAGTEVKHTGDGIMASFPSASQALQCAIAVQQAVTAQADTPFRVRIGLNAGEPVAEEQDLFGTAVQLARRVCDRAEPGQILVSNVVRELAAGKGFLFSDHGDVELRGFEDPVRLYEVRWKEGA
jgi:class 3 adenylate cyclase